MQRQLISIKANNSLFRLQKHTSYPSFLSFLFYVWEIGVCVCVCTYVRARVCACVCAHTYEHACMCVCLHIHKCMCVDICAQMHVCLQMCTYMCARVCMLLCVHIHMCMCVHVSVCMRACVWCVCVNINLHCSPFSGAGGGLSLNQELLSSQSNDQHASDAGIPGSIQASFYVDFGILTLVQ